MTRLPHGQTHTPRVSVYTVGTLLVNRYTGSRYHTHGKDEVDFEGQRELNFPF